MLLPLFRDDGLQKFDDVFRLVKKIKTVFCASHKTRRPSAARRDVPLDDLPVLHAARRRLEVLEKLVPLLEAHSATNARRPRSVRVVALGAPPIRRHFRVFRDARQTSRDELDVLLLLDELLVLRRFLFFFAAIRSDARRTRAFALRLSRNIRLDPPLVPVAQPRDGVALAPKRLARTSFARNVRSYVFVRGGRSVVLGPGLLVFLKGKAFVFRIPRRVEHRALVLVAGEPRRAFALAAL